MKSGERGAARTEYSIALAFAGVLVAIAMPRILTPPADAGWIARLLPWVLLTGAAALLALAASTWWRERPRRR